MKAPLFVGILCWVGCGGVFADESVYDSEITYISSSPAQCGGDAFIKLKPAHPSCVFAYVKSTEPREPLIKSKRSLRNLTRGRS